MAKRTFSIPALPESLAVERGVLGPILGGFASELAGVVEILPTPAYFANRACAVVWRAILAVYELGEAVDIISVSGRLRAEGTLEEAGGIVALTELAARSPTSAALGTHARMVRHHYIARGVVETAVGVLAAMTPPVAGDLARDPIPPDPVGVATGAVERLEGYLGMTKTGPRRDEIEDRTAVVTEVLIAAVDPESMTFTPSGFPALDGIIGGFRPGELTVLAGRPGSGKSAFALSLALNITGLVTSSRMDPSRPILFYELEMTRQQTWSRVVAAMTGLDGMRFGNPGTRFVAEELERIKEARQRICVSGLHVDTCGSWTLTSWRRDLERRMARYKPAVVIIDAPYIFRRARGHSTNAEIEVVFQGIKGAAKEFDVPVIAIHQLNREVESRYPPRPRLSDLRDSGSIEQEADCVLMAYRPEYYNPTCDPAGVTYEDGGEMRGRGDIQIMKQRNGPVGVARLAFTKETALWGDVATTVERSRASSWG